MRIEYLTGHKIYYYHVFKSNMLHVVSRYSLPSIKTTTKMRRFFFLCSVSKLFTFEICSKINCLTQNRIPHNSKMCSMQTLSHHIWSTTKQMSTQIVAYSIDPISIFQIDIKIAVNTSAMTMFEVWRTYVFIVPIINVE